MLSREEWVKRTASGESDQVEFKSSTSDMNDIRTTVCAFANDWPNHQETSWVIIGLDDEGSPSGVQVGDDTLKKLSELRNAGNLLPQPQIKVLQYQHEGHDIVVVEVLPSKNVPIRYKGRCYVRVGPTTRIASTEEEKTLSERRRSYDLPFDMQACEATSLKALNLNFFEQHYLKLSIAPEILEQNNRPIQFQLESLRMMKGENPTYGGLLILGENPLDWIPGAYVQFLRFDGVYATDPIKDEKRIDGRIDQVFHELDELLKINISTAIDMISRAKEQRIPDYPIIALQQVIRNAVIHRTYEGTNAPIRIYWFNDRIEVSNPGGLYGSVNQDNFGQGNTDYRNPTIAEAARYLGYVQKFGLGIPIAREELKKNGNLMPEFKFEPNHFHVTITAKNHENHRIF